MKTISKHINLYKKKYTLLVVFFGSSMALFNFMTAKELTANISSLLLGVFKEDGSFISSSIVPIIEKMTGQWIQFSIILAIVISAVVFFLTLSYFKKKINQIIFSNQQELNNLKRNTKIKITKLKLNFVVPLKMVEKSSSYASCIVDKNEIIVWGSQSFFNIFNITTGKKGVQNISFGNLLSSKEILNTSNITKEMGCIQLRSGINLKLNTKHIQYEGESYRYIEMLPSEKTHINDLPKIWNLNDDVFEIVESYNLLHKNIKGQVTKKDFLYSMLPQDLVMELLSATINDLYLYACNNYVTDILINLKETSKCLVIEFCLKNHRTTDETVARSLIENDKAIHSLKTRFNTLENKRKVIKFNISIKNRIQKKQSDAYFEISFKNNIKNNEVFNRKEQRRINEFQI